MSASSRIMTTHRPSTTKILGGYYLEIVGTQECFHHPAARRSRPQKWLGSSATPNRPSSSSEIESTGSLQDSCRCHTERKSRRLALQFFHLFSVSGATRTFCFFAIAAELFTRVSSFPLSFLVSLRLIQGCLVSIVACIRVSSKVVVQ